MLAFAGSVYRSDCGDGADTGGQSGDSPGTDDDSRGDDPGILGTVSGVDRVGRAIKQLVLMTILVNVFFPFGLSADWSAWTFLFSLPFCSSVKLLLLAVVVAMVEVSNAKMRLFRVPELAGYCICDGSALALVSTFLFQG
jgi:hypothetical protein